MCIGTKELVKVAALLFATYAAEIFQTLLVFALWGARYHIN